MNFAIPESALVLLIGPSGAGKTTFARRHFLATEVISSDGCRGLVSDDESSLEATADAFELVHLIASKRLARGKLTVIDATNVKPESRAALLHLARMHQRPAVALVLDVPEEVCIERNRARPGRNVNDEIVRTHVRQLRRTLEALPQEGFDSVRVLTLDEIEQATRG
jgi:predicted kinase